MVPDYISEKKMRELKLSKGETEGNGDCDTHGDRSFLTPDRSGNGYDNVANAGNYEPGKPKYYGRFNQGVVTINLVDVACSSQGDEKKFWEIFDERLELCHKALMCRHNRLKGTLRRRAICGSMAHSAVCPRASPSTSYSTAVIPPFRWDTRVCMSV